MSSRASSANRPRLRTGETAEELRHATWLELFYDLVFVVAVARLAHVLADDVSVRGALQYAALFVPLWWAWTGQTFYANRFDTDDSVHRLFSVLQISAVAVMAASVSHALDDRSTAFALGYAAVRFGLVLEYLRARRWVPEARPLIDHYLVGFSTAASLWVVSTFLDEPVRYGVWVVAMVIDLVTPLLSRKQQAGLPPQSQHLPERFGLFAVIVLGEAFAGTVHGLEEVDLTARPLLIAAAGIVVAVGIWWVYFADLAESVALRTRVAGQVWVYGHLLLFIGTAGIGAAVDHAITHDGLDRPTTWLLTLTVALAYLAVGLLHAAAGQPRRAVPRFLASGACVLAGVLAGAVPLLALLVPVLVAVVQVLLELTPEQVERAGRERSRASETELLEDVEELERRGVQPPRPSGTAAPGSVAVGDVAPGDLAPGAAEQGPQQDGRPLRQPL